MKITKVYEAIVNLSATEMFHNIDQIVLEKLKKRFEGKCEKNTLVLKITEIVKRSAVRMAKNRLDGSGDVCVQFQAEAVVYNREDIFTGCEVLRVERGNTIICKTEHAVISLKGNNNLRSLKVGQTLTAKVMTVSYPSKSEKIGITGVPYTYSFKFIIFLAKLSPEDETPENKEILKRKLQEIDNEYTLYEKADKSLLKFFNDLFYPFKNKQNPDVSFVDAYQIVKKAVERGWDAELKKEFCFIRHPVIDKSTTKVMKFTEAEINDAKSKTITELLNPNSYGFEIVRESLFNTFLTFLNDYLNFIRMLREMTEIYADEKMRESHNNIWVIYLRLKKE